MKEVDGYEEALQEAQEKIDYLDEVVAKAEAQIKTPE